ncbi:MAG: PDZ domain-containing protein [Myxococcota bacterium]
MSTIAFCLAACAPPRGTIGAVLAQRNNGTLIVRQVPKGLAAERAGVQPGDEVLLIDGRDVRALSSDGVHRALSGEVGEPVKLTLVRDDRVVRVTLARSAAPARRRERPD